MNCSPAKRSTENKLPGETGSAEIDEAFFSRLFNKPQFDSVVANKHKWNVQVIYTQIDRNSSNRPRLTTYTFNNKPSYFYPASTVKLPLSLLALQKLNELRAAGIPVDRNTTMITGVGYSGQVAVNNDPGTPDGRATVGQYIKKIFLVSDNDAANRLYEFLGQDYINEQLLQKSYPEAQIIHRLGIFLSEDENRHTNPVSFYDSKGKVIYDQPMQNSELSYANRNDFLGKGFYRNGELINEPMDFSRKNRISLESLHKMIISLIIPGAIKKESRFNISKDDRMFVLKYMSQFPGESVYPYYDTSEYHDAYDKFILYGSGKGSLPKNIRIFNKVGNAYGQLMDVAYIADLENKIEFFVSAAITCNTDEILNDDKYDYDTIGFPFMKALGQALYEYEKNRIKKVKPDLSAFIFNYDK